MASVTELLLAAKAKQSPFMSLAEGAAQGFGQAQSGALQRAAQLIAMEDARVQREQRAKAQEEMRKRVAAASEASVQQGLRGTKEGQPLTPPQKLKETFDEQGNYTATFETVPPDAPKAPSYQAKEYADAQGKTRIGRFNPQTGKMEQSADDAFAPPPVATPGLAYQQEKDAKKEAIDIKELQIPGYELGPDVRPTQKEAQDLRTASGAMQDFSKGVDRLRELMEQHGSTQFFGTAGGEMKSLAANLKLTLKEVQKLGVLSSSDIAFLDAQIPDPSTWGSVATSTSTAVKQLDTVKERSASVLAESLKARGYRPAASSSGAPAPTVAGKPAPTKAPAGVKKVGRFTVAQE